MSIIIRYNLNIVLKTCRAFMSVKKNLWPSLPMKYVVLVSNTNNLKNSLRGPPKSTPDSIVKWIYIYTYTHHNVRKDWLVTWTLKNFFGLKTGFFASFRASFSTHSLLISICNCESSKPIGWKSLRIDWRVGSTCWL
jgi:hypothetical protein